MGRKLKYKDVVKKPPSNFTKKVSKRGKNFKKTKERKTFSIYKENHNNKRKHDDASDENNHSKKSKEELEDKLIKQVYEPEPSDSEEEIEENPLKLLRATFGDKIDDSIISSSDTEEEEENIQEDLDADDSAGSGSDTGEELEEPQNSPDSLSEDEEKESDLDIQTEEENLENSLDPFVQHVCYELHPSLLESLDAQPPLVEIHKKTWPRLGNLLIQIPQCSLKENCNNSILDKTTYALPSAVPKKISSKSTPKELHIKSQIVPNLMAANKGLLRQETLFTPLQQEIFSIVNNYQDLLYPERTFDNAQEIRFVYCLHAVNHVLKTRIKVLHHNAKLSKKDDVPEEFRDQGLVRPKILIVAPFKDSAYKIINTIITILFKEDKGNVIKKNRFVEDYTGNELYMPKKNPKPEDYEKTFCGNTGDDFKIGMSVTKKSLKLYSDFYSSDIIVASPLGLRTIIGAEGEPDRDFDFLTSLEILILDQTEIFSMQNWDHIIHLFNHMHLKPKDLHGTDVSRVRQWCLNLWAKYYRQTLIFSSLTTPEINSIFNKKCANFAGKVKVANPIEPGCMSQIFVQLPHVFHKFSANSPADAVERRFNFFVQKVLPQQRDSRMKQTLIYVPSYFDYVKLRNYFKREDIGFVQI
ncbi:U3 small nucleolar RNA-associated protein 25 homolog isoform X2 [Anthonomus grandis grandis]|nr:U3 small nucleolar RNA-associated protein 25 homolog isoform X2 [Anthonomus grandis grandis]